MKILFSSNSPFAATGYGNQTKYFTPQIKRLGHDITIQAFFGTDMYNAPINWDGIQIFGRGADPYGRDVLIAQAKTLQADIVITLFDAWTYDPMMMKEVRWCPWFPVDSDPIPPPVLEKVRYAFDRIVFSKFAEKQMQDNDLSCHYVPHGTDTELFKPVAPADRITLRERLGFPLDAFIVGMVAANKGYPSRKAFEQNIAAFKELRKKHSDAVLYLHTLTGEHGGDCVNLMEYVRSLGLVPNKDVFFCEQLIYFTSGYPDQHMAALYNCFDVLLSVSRGEGFGIPILEAQAAGCPVIVGDWTAMGELCFSGWKVAKSEAIKDYTRLNTYQYLPNIDAIADRLEAAYKMRGNEDYRLRARKGAVPYDFRRVADYYWKPALEAIAGRIEKVEKLRAMVAQPAAKPSGSVAVREVAG